MRLPQEITNAIGELVHQLVERHYAQLESDGRAGRLTAKEIETAINEYGSVLIDPPAEALRAIDAYEIEGTDDEWFVNFDLWTAEEGRSDLTLSIDARRDERGKAVVVIDDLHVL